MQKITIIDYLVVDDDLSYNIILKRPTLNSIQAIVSMLHLKLKFPTSKWVDEVVCDVHDVWECYTLAITKIKDISNGNDKKWTLPPKIEG